MIRVLAIVLALWAILPVQCPAWADWRADIGFEDLQTALGGSPLDAAGIPVTQVEAPASGHWMPNPADAEFSGKTIANQSGDSGYSGHATTVGQLFYGNTRSLVPAIDTIDSYEANDWILYSFLRWVYNWQPDMSSSRVANHSWVGSMTASYAGDMLRRLDWVIDVDEFIQVVATGGTGSALLGSGFNVIAAGRTDGAQATGSAALDAVYTTGRSRPEIVAPMTSLSSATPAVASAAALLVAAGADPSLSTDPLEIYTTNRKGERIYNGQRAEVVKAALMAGADRFTRNLSTTANIIDYRNDSANWNSNGTDRRFGAGQVNIDNSYWILTAGEQNSAEDLLYAGGQIGFEGFDYDPSFGGLSGSNRTASYYFTTDAGHRLLSAALVWHLRVDGGTPYAFDGTATFYDLDLRLFDMTAGGTETAASASALDNTENLFVSLQPNRLYMLQVAVGNGQPDFDWDYALAWQIVADADGDTIPDHLDNCRLTANTAQVDTDADGYGNICDCDLNNDDAVNMLDYGLFRKSYGAVGADLDADFNADGAVNMLDYGILMRRYGSVAPFE